MARRLAALSAEWEAARQEDPRPEDDPARRDEPAPSGGPGSSDDREWESDTRVRGPLLVALEDPASAVPSDDGSALTGSTPVPGRHAARRPSAPVAERVAVPGVVGRLLEHVGLRVTHLVWVAAFAMAALAVTSWWLVRAKETAVVTPVAAPAVVGESSGGASPAATPGGGVPSPATGTAAEVVVDVAGKVRRPGLVVLPAGSRVADALEAAGGARRGVDLQPLNLARVLVDGEQIVVGAPPGTATPGGTSVPTPSDGAPGGLVNLNTATQPELEELPGVGPVTAAAIIEWRTRHGGFASVEDLLEVSGIGEVTLERLAPLVTV